MNDRPIEQRAARISFVNGLSTVLTLVFQLVSVPVCLRYWGKEPYGAWLSMLSAFTILRSAEGGFVAYVGNKLNYLYHQDVGALRKHLASAACGIAVVGSLQLLLAAAALIFGPLASLLGVADLHGSAAPLGLMILVGSWVLTGSYVGILHRLLIPAGLMYQSAWWGMAFQVAQFAAVMLAAVWNLDLLATSALFAAVQAIIYVSSGFYVRHALPRFYPWLKGAELATGLRDLFRSLTLTVSTIVQQVGTNGMVLMVSAFAGPAAVPLFTTVRTVANLWTSVTNIVTAPLLPEVVRIHAKGEAHKLAAMNQAFWVLAGSAVNLGVLVSYPVMPRVYALWTGRAVALNSPLLALLLAGVVVANAGALIALLLNGINGRRIVLVTSRVRAALALGVGALMHHVMGLAGFGVGVLAGEVAVSLIAGAHFFRTEIRQRGAPLAAVEFGPVLLGTCSVTGYFVSCALEGSSLWGWVLAFLAVVASSVWGWRTLDPDVRGRMTGLATRLAAFT